MGKVLPTRAADWLSVTARWVLLLGTSFWLGLTIGFTLPILIILVLVGLANTYLSIIVLLDLQTTQFRLFIVIGDALFAYAIFILAQEVGLYIAWLGLLPLITATIYFQWVVSLVLLILNLIVQGTIAYMNAPVEYVIPFLVLLLSLYLFVGGAVVYGTHRWLYPTGYVLTSKSQTNGFTPGLAPFERRRAIYDLIAELSSSLSYQRILENVISLSTNTLIELGAPVDDLVSVVMIFTDDESQGTELEVITFRLLLPTDTYLKLPGVSGLIGKVIEDGKSDVTKDVRNDPELSHFISLHDYETAYCIPLRSGLEVYGVMLFAHTDPEFFVPERREVLEIVGKQFVIAIQNARLYQDLELEKERMMSIQEDARKKMARDLHDGPTQAIAAIALRVNFARRLMERDLKAAAEELHKIEELARHTTKEIRHMLFTLRPLVLESKGLAEALDAMAEKMKDTFDQEVIIQVSPVAVDALGPGKQAVVFYLAEEAVNNARKHAQADHIWVILRIYREGIGLLEIKDDGVGFDVAGVTDAYEDRGSLGMINMQERTELINGIIQIDSKVGVGTSVRIAIPLNDDAADELRQGM
jgi:signal transduction histidine kinase